MRDAMRVSVTISLMLVIGACGDKQPANKSEPEPPPLREVRKSLRRPSASGPPIEDGYFKAKRVALGVLAPRAHTADAVFVVARDWARAPKPLRSLGADARSGEVATLVAAGAAAPDGKVPAGAAQEWADVGAVAVAYAAERDLAGETVEAAWHLLAATRLGYDITLERPPPQAKHGLDLVGGALAALQSITQRANAEALPTDDLAAVFAACRELMINAPTAPAAATPETGNGGKWTKGEWSYRYRRAGAELSATCFIIARTLEARGAKPAGEPILDPITEKPWQVDGGVIRSGELEHQGVRERLEFPILGAE